jgi:hypothetical protein
MAESREARLDSREQLRVAHETFSDIGPTGLAERTGRVFVPVSSMPDRLQPSRR